MELMVLKFVEAGLEHQSWTVNRLAQHLRSPKTVSFAIRRPKALIGFVMLQIQRTTAHLDLLVVNPDFRRQGIGRQLVEEALQLAAVSHATEISLEVRKSNTSAQIFYQRLGFVRDREIERYYCAKETAIRFKRLLTPNGSTNAS